MPILNDQIHPKFLQAGRLEKTAGERSSRLKLFSGTANPALSQVENENTCIQVVNSDAA